MTKPLVSILIPAYNSEEWIADTLRSACAQTWSRKEIIVVDDGSTDHTAEVAQQFKSETLRVCTQKNQGAAAARNKALSLSQGDYIQWLDADDLLAPDKIARQMEFVQHGLSARTLLSGAWGQFIQRPRQARFYRTSLWNDLSPAEFMIRKLGQRVFMQTAVWLVSRQLTEAAGPWDILMVSDDDGEYFSRVMLASDGIRFVPEAKVYYRVAGPSSLSYVGRSNRKLEALWGSMQLHISYLRSVEDSERSRQACLAYLQNYLISFQPFRPDIVQEMHNAARQLDGRLRDPGLSWKYSWIRAIFGWNKALRAQFLLRRARWWVSKKWDGLLLLLSAKRMDVTDDGQKRAL